MTNVLLFCQLAKHDWIMQTGYTITTASPNPNICTCQSGIDSPLLPLLSGWLQICKSPNDQEHQSCQVPSEVSTAENRSVLHRPFALAACIDLVKITTIRRFRRRNSGLEIQEPVDHSRGERRLICALMPVIFTQVVYVTNRRTNHVIYYGCLHRFQRANQRFIKDSSKIHQFVDHLRIGFKLSQNRTRTVKRVVIAGRAQ